MRTGEVAGEAGVNLQTLRYCERQGLLPEPPRRESGYRIYGPDGVRIVRFINRAQELGFSLDEVESLLELADGGAPPPGASPSTAGPSMPFAPPTSWSFL